MQDDPTILGFQSCPDNEVSKRWIEGLYSRCKGNANAGQTVPVHKIEIKCMFENILSGGLKCIDNALHRFIYHALIVLLFVDVS